MAMTRSSFLLAEDENTITPSGSLSDILRIRKCRRKLCAKDRFKSESIQAQIHWPPFGMRCILRAKRRETRPRRDCRAPCLQS